MVKIKIKLRAEQNLLREIGVATYQLEQLLVQRARKMVADRHSKVHSKAPYRRTIWDD